MNLVQQRILFEQWVMTLPGEQVLARYGPDEGRNNWPGQYKNYAVQCAWEAWQAATKRAKEAKNDPHPF